MRQQDFADRFAESDAAEAERRNERRAYLVGALAQVRASSDLRIFVTSVFRHAGTDDRWWAVTIRDLIGESSAPGSLLDPLTDRLGCSERQAKRVTALSRKLGLVSARPASKHASRGGCCADESLQPGEHLEYQIDWVGVRRAIGLKTHVESEGQPGTHVGQPGTHVGQPGTHEDGTIRNKYPVPVPDRCFERNTNRNGTGTGARGDPSTAGGGRERPKLLDGVTVGVLGDTRQMLALLGEVCEVSPIEGLTDCEADQLWWLTAAEYALRVGKNPPAYWRYLVFGNRRQIPKLIDQDAAHARLKKEAAECLT